MIFFMLCVCVLLLISYSSSTTKNFIYSAQIPLEVESALLQQVMNLTPEQLSSLPAEQREQVLELQKAMSLKLLSTRNQ